MRWQISLVVAVLGVAALASEARAQEMPPPLDFEPPARGVIQNRKYQLLNEVTLLGGGLPTDPFSKGLTATLGYTLHFSDALAWEILQGTYVYSIDSKVKKEVERLALADGNPPQAFPRIEWIAASHLVLKPFYGKEALFNTDVVHLEAYAQAGPAIVSRMEVVRTLSYGLDVGVGVRLWLTRAVSVRLDLGELVYVVNRSVEQAMHLHAGLAFNLRGAYE